MSEDKLKPILRVIDPNVEHVPGYRPRPLYISTKMQVYLKLKGIGLQDIESAKAVKEMYDREKQDLGLTSVTLITLERLWAENALNVATRGGLRKRRV